MEFTKTNLSNKNFLFVNITVDDCYYGVNQGISILVPIVKKFSYNVSCLDINSTMDTENFYQQVLAFNPSIVAFSFIANQYKYLKKYSDTLAKAAEILQIAGGTGITLDFENYLNNTSLNGICIGEGETPMTNLLTRIEKQQDIYDTPGFYWKKNGILIKNNIPQFVDNLSTLDFPDFSVFNKNSVVNEIKQAQVVITRGCIYNCHYCCNSALSSIYPSKKQFYRAPSIEYSISFLEKLKKDYPDIEDIIFLDEFIIANEAWFIGFAKEYEKRIHLPNACCLRIESITPNTARALKNMGCQWARIGLECGCEDFRKKILNRNYSNKSFIEKCTILKNEGIKIFTFNMIGLPFEGVEEREKTLNLNKAIDADSGICTFFYPFKGTKLYEICKENNLLKDNHEVLKITNFSNVPGIKMTKYDETQCVLMQQVLTLFLKRKLLKRKNY